MPDPGFLLIHSARPALHERFLQSLGGDLPGAHSPNTLPLWPVICVEMPQQPANTLLYQRKPFLGLPVAK